MLSEEQKSLIRAEEAFRDAVRAELAAGKGGRSRWQKLLEFLNMPVGGWVLGTVLVAAFSFLWTQAYERLHVAERELAERRANAQKDVELVTRLLPSLANVGTPENPLALQVVGPSAGDRRHRREARRRAADRGAPGPSTKVCAAQAGAPDDQQAHGVPGVRRGRDRGARREAARGAGFELPAPPPPPPGGRPQAARHPRRHPRRPPARGAAAADLRAHRRRIAALRRADAPIALPGPEVPDARRRERRPGARACGRRRALLQRERRGDGEARPRRDAEARDEGRSGAEEAAAPGASGSDRDLAGPGLR